MSPFEYPVHYCYRMAKINAIAYIVQNVLGRWYLLHWSLRPP
jgi:hypothetical protein